MNAPLDLPPHSIEAEQSVLGALLLDNSSRARIADCLTDVDFYREDHRKIFRAINLLLDAASPADALTVAESLKARNELAAVGGVPYLLSLSETTPSAANILAYAEMVRNHATERRTRALGNQIALGTVTLAQARDEIEAIQKAALHPPASRMDWTALASLPVPEREWIVRDWLGCFPTLLTGSGGVGKSMFAMSLMSHIAMGGRAHTFLGDIDDAYPCVGWFCEDDAGELHRRQAAIANAMGLSLQAFDHHLHIVPRVNEANALCVSTSAGAIEWTPALAELRAQVRDTKSRVVVLDNVSHLMQVDAPGAATVTAFVNRLKRELGDVALILLHHAPKGGQSQFLGSVAWENAVRMRWYFADHHPNEMRTEGATQDNGLRFLSKSKANYSRKGIAEFAMTEGGALMPALENQSSAHLAFLERKRDESAVRSACAVLTSRGLAMKAAANSPNFIGKFIKTECPTLDRDRIKGIVERLIATGELAEETLGRKDNRHPITGLVYRPRTLNDP